MANEPHPAGRGVLYAKTESTYGTDPTLAKADVQYIEQEALSATPILEPRVGISGYRGGFRPRLVGQDNKWGFRVEMIPEVIAASDTIVPTIEPFLRACGFGARAYSAGSPNTASYTLLSHGHGSCAIEERFFIPSLADGIGRQYLGCRCDWTIEIDGQGTWWLIMDGASKTGTAIPAPAFESDTDYEFSASGGGNGPAIGSETTVTLTSLEAAGDVIYGTASLNAIVTSAKITGNMNLVLQPGLHGGVGPARVILNPTDGVGIELLMEQQIDAEWDPFAWMQDASTAQNAFSCLIENDNGAGVLRLTDVGETGIFMSMTELTIVNEENGVRMWRINHSGIYPEVAADGGGIRPANNFMLQYLST